MTQIHAFIYINTKAQIHTETQKDMHISYIYTKTHRVNDLPKTQTHINRISNIV